MLHYQQGRPEQALVDLRRALDDGADAVAVHYDLAVVHNAQGDVPTALRHAQTAVELDPSHEPSRQLRDTIRQRIPDADTASDRR
jgi:tetratricopeptide (TPR) repeat protein